MCNKNLLFTDKFNFLQNKLFELGVIFHFTPVLSKVFDNNFIQNYYWEMVSLVLGTYFCLFLVELRGLWAHLTSISHLTSCWECNDGIRIAIEIRQKVVLSINGNRLPSGRVRSCYSLPYSTGTIVRGNYMRSLVVYR